MTHYEQTADQRDANDEIERLHREQIADASDENEHLHREQIADQRDANDEIERLKRLKSAEQEAANAAYWARGYLESAGNGVHNETGPEFAARMLTAWYVDHPIMKRGNAG